MNGGAWRRGVIAATGLVMALMSVAATGEVEDAELRRMAANVLMVGFRGDSVTADNAVRDYVGRLGVGGVILFDVDLTGSREPGSRNITSRERLARLTADLQSLTRAGEGRLLIAVDQEGGKVQRLKARYGYTTLPSARRLGLTGSVDSTRHYAAISAAELAESGINVNLAPEVDVHRSDCPVIGRLERAYSADPDSVALHAGAVVEEHARRGIISTLKHFPGHGSATTDSHYGLTDVTKRWSREELLPFKELIAAGKAPAVMTAHIFNGQIDEEYPATLSRKTITGVLREELGYDGLVLTDDMYMQGIIDNYAIEDAIVLALNAGADMLVMGNNITTGFEAERPERVVEIIVKAVKDGKIAIERLAEASARVDRARGR